VLIQWTIENKGHVMRYYLDCEFNGLGGELISLALVRGYDGAAIYVVFKLPENVDPWVADNVVPILDSVPFTIETTTWDDAAHQIELMLSGDTDPLIISDWPDDIRYLCGLLITGPGTMIRTSGRSINFSVYRVDAYPTVLPGAVQHNAWWDANALRFMLEPGAELHDQPQRPWNP
jgi:hypothetical protein